MLTLKNALAPFAGQYSAKFLAAMDFTLLWETEFQSGHDGDYNFVRTEDVPGDGGGLTRYGIDATDHPNLHVASLTLAEALAVYHGGEWTQVRGEQLPPDIALAVFDAAVNVGTKHAAKWLQEAVGTAQDGSIGPVTIQAAKDAQPGTAAALVDRYRTAYYTDLGEEYPRDKEFEAGWLDRTQALAAAITPAVPDSTQETA